METIYIIYNTLYHYDTKPKFLGYTKNIELAEEFIDLFSGPLRTPDMELGIMEMDSIESYIELSPIKNKLQHFLKDVM